MIVFLKALVRGGAAGDLFAVPVPVKGHTTAAGVTVAPHTALRLKRAAAAPATVPDLFAWTSGPAAAPAAPAPALPAPATLDDIAALLETTPKNLPARVASMKLGDTCGRCLGSGSYSYNLKDGSKCYGCDGRGQTFPKDLQDLRRRAAVAVDSGALALHQDKLRARQAVKNAVDRVSAAVQQVELLNGYDAVWRDASNPAHAETVRLNRICSDASDRVWMAFMGHDIRGGKKQPLPDVLEQERILNGALADIEGVRQHLLAASAAGTKTHPDAVPTSHGLPANSIFVQGKGVFGRGRWRVDVPGVPNGNYSASKDEAVTAARQSIANHAHLMAAKAKAAADDARIAGKLRAGVALSASDLADLDLRPGRSAEFGVLSPLAQRLLGVSKAKVREAMGDALRLTHSDMGVPKHFARPDIALANVAAYLQAAKP